MPEGSFGVVADAGGVERVLRISGGKRRED
jgi:hypothetical protein